MKWMMSASYIKKIYSINQELLSHTFIFNLIVVESHDHITLFQIIQICIKEKMF